MNCPLRKATKENTFVSRTAALLFKKQPQTEQSITCDATKS